MLSILSHQGNADQNYSELSLTLIKMTNINRQTKTNVEKDVEELEPHTLLVGI